MFLNHVSKKLSAYLHGELQTEDARRVAEHLRGCRSCRAEFEEIEFGAQMAGQLRREQAPESLWAELELAMSRESFSNRRGAKNAEAAQRDFGFSWWSLKVGLAGAAVVAIAVLTFVYLKLQPEQELPDNRPSWEVTRLDGR
ncbi:MAG: zf-HC2 domain-containing protein, partial [Acidobacteriota bacterium]